MTPEIQIMSPRTDLCDTCQHFRDGLHYNAHQEEEAKDLLKRYKEHLSKAKVERNYYNKNTKLAEEQRKLIKIIQRVKHHIAALMQLLIIVMIEPKMFMCLI